MNEETYNEQGISLSDLFFLIKRNFLMILIITIICAIAGGVYAFSIKKPVYTAIATAVVQAEPTNNGSEATSYSYSVALTNTFKDLIKNITVINVAADELIDENNYSEGERNALKAKLQKNVSVSSTTSTLTLTVSANSTTPEEAILLANAILKATVSVVDKYAVNSETGEVIKDTNGEPVHNYIILANKLKVFSEASMDTTSIKSNKLIIVAVAIVIGLVISFGIILVKYLSDDTFTSKESFEKAYNINILSSIHEADGGNL